MKIIKLSIVFLMLAFAGCKKFDDFQVDPNRTTQATPDLLLTTIERLAFDEVNSGAAMASRQLVFTDGVDNQQYYGWQRGNFNDYSSLLQVVRMEHEATRVNKPVYLALAKFFRAYFGVRLSLTFGDIPFSQALKGDEGTYTSVYDTQEEVFRQSLDLLKEANLQLKESNEIIQGDVVYGGDLLQWRKLVNSFSLRVLMALSNQEDNATINVKQRFAEIVNDPVMFPLFESNADNAQLEFFDVQGNRYPHFNDNNMQTAIYMEESFVDTLQRLQDPRLFSFATKAPKYAALPDNDFNAYGGVNGSDPITVNTTRVVAGEASKINPRFYLDPVNEPSIAMSFAEVQFILAEAAMRGWIAGDAESFYNEGISASMEFYGIPASQIEDYLQQPGVALNSGNEIHYVILQKYIASFMNSGWNSFFEQRRTGFPTFDVSGGGILNDGRIPKRWMYPEVELQLNRDAVTAAIARQFPQGDEVNGLMWILE